MVFLPEKSPPTVDTEALLFREKLLFPIIFLLFHASIIHETQENANFSQILQLHLDPSSSYHFSSIFNYKKQSSI